jgi:hypothetical protein
LHRLSFSVTSCNFVEGKKGKHKNSASLSKLACLGHL